MFPGSEQGRPAAAPAGGAGVPARSLGASTAAAAVVASMVGTGALTTTGILVETLGAPGLVLVAWAVGGLAALAGALCYAELGAALPANGGEYRLLGRIYHPAAGFVAGWISLVVGFAAPAAASALAFGHYLAAVFPVSPPVAGGALLVAVSALHAADVKAGARFQEWATAAKVALVAALALLLLFTAGRPVAPAFAFDGEAGGIASPSFAVALILVSFAYSGWNAAVYLAGEVREPRRHLPRALVGGTLLVVSLYLVLNVALLVAVPPAELAGVVEVVHVAAGRVWGEGAGRAVSLVIAALLVSSVSVLTLAGPRVVEAMGGDFPRLRALSRRRGRGGPARAVWLQTGLSLLFLATASFETILTFTGFLLSVSAGATVIGVAVLRRRERGLERPYRTPWYPLPVIGFAALAAWMAISACIERPVVVLVGAAFVAVGLGLYFVFSRGERS